MNKQLADPSQEFFSKTFAPDFLDKLLNLLREKGQEYSQEGAFDNFNAIAQLMGVSREEYLLTISSKHWVALIDWSKGKTELSSTSSTERIQDLIIYLLLLALMIQHEEVPHVEI